MEKVKNNSAGLNDIENLIWKAFEKVRDDYDKFPKPHEHRNNKWITKTIKERVGQIGNDRKYKIASTEHGGEWHYDLTWYKNNEVGCLEKVILALESELSDRNPKGLNDFEKLLVSNADYKVWICFAKGNFNFPKNVNELIEKFDRSVNSYVNLKAGSRTLVLIWEDYMEGNIHSHLIVKR